MHLRKNKKTVKNNLINSNVARVFNALDIEIRGAIYYPCYIYDIPKLR